MKILGVSGSPRKDGNTDIALRTALNIIGEGMPSAEIEFLRIADHRIEHCRGCRYCMTHVECAIKGDDLELLVGKMLAADLTILGAPVYWWGPPGILKDFIDRTHAFYPDDTRFSDKKIAVITVAAQSGFPSHERIMGWLRHYGAEYIAWLRLFAREKEELQDKPGQLAKLKEFSKNLVDVRL